jgi:hypothetical protein
VCCPGFGPIIPRPHSESHRSGESWFAELINDFCNKSTNSGRYHSCGRDASCLAPPAQIRTCSFPAYGSYLESLTAMLRLGQGWRIRGRGSHSFISWVI